jgi:integrase
MITIRPYKGGRGFEVDIRVESIDGEEIRKRVRAPVSSRSAAEKWAKRRERDLMLFGDIERTSSVPDLETFVPRFLERHARANRQKPSAVATQEGILRNHLVPRLGKLRLDQISNEDVQHLKSALRDRSPKTVNNVLSVLNVVLTVAVEWEVLSEKPCSIKLLRTARTDAPFFDFEEYERLVAAAREVDWRAHLAVLLGGEAGLRCGEMLALEWGDVNFSLGQLAIERSDWEGHITLPKGGRPRRIPLTTRLAGALEQRVNRKAKRVICEPDGEPITRKVFQHLVRRSARRAGIAQEGIHVLRHTFCSHLAMRGAPARAIQELAGHKDLSTTQRYMHLSPAALDSAIQLLEPTGLRERAPGRGDILETAKS